MILTANRTDFFYSHLSVNPAVKQAVKSVKATGKSAYKGVRSKMKENHSSSNLTGGSGTLRVGNSWRTDKDRRLAVS